jgi:N-acetylglutamate synthase-like GNAT family acetyltransferase
MEQIRPLKASDKEDILEIALHTWEGHDYLPYFFKRWLNDPDSYTAAIEHGGHVIALANLRVIENGKTGWMEGLRVHPEHRGKGLASILTKHVVKTAKELSVQRIRYTTAIDNETSLHLGKTIGMEKKFELSVDFFANPETITWRSKEKLIEQVTFQELYPDLINTGLIPCNVIIYDWKALDITRESLEKISEFSGFWVQKRDGKISSFSLGYAKEHLGGEQWCFTIYTKIDSQFLDHLSYHIRKASECKCASMFVAFPTDFFETFQRLDWNEWDEIHDFRLAFLEREL